MRIRIQGNYRSFFTDSFKTLRLSSFPPVTPELEDVAINDQCLANCSYCYTNALKTGTNFEGILEKAELIWGVLPLNDRPFQIAIGGAGEPTLHPQFVDFLSKVKSLNIVPNYTTNGMHLTDTILRSTEELCGGVALSWHPHIKNIFHRAVNQLREIDTKLNFHIIVGESTSIQHLEMLYETYKDDVDYFVILPYQAVGRAKLIEVENCWHQVFQWIGQKSEERQKQFAFGALFYEFFTQYALPFKLSIYNPDVYSGYRILDNNYKKLYKSSYDLTEKDSLHVLY